MEEWGRGTGAGSEDVRGACLGDCVTRWANTGGCGNESARAIRSFELVARGTMRRPVFISTEVIDQVSDRIGGMTDLDAAQALSVRFSTSQPALTAYILQFTEELSSDASQLGYFLSLVLWQCFETARPGSVLEITPEQVIARHEAIDQELGALQGVDDRLIERRILYSDDYPEPGILRHIVESIYEPNDDIELTPDEQGHLFIVLRVAADCLDQASR